MTAEARARVLAAEERLGIQMLPAQREIAERVLDGESVMMVGGRQNGHTTLKRVIQEAVPRRIQMSRQRPWRAEHPDAVIVARGPGRKWGNPVRVVHDKDGWFIQIEGLRLSDSRPTAREARKLAVDLFASSLEHAWDRYPSLAEIRDELRGRDLACWCPPGPCHADVLLALANSIGEAQ